MNFFEHQAQARAFSARLVVLFAITVAATAAAMALATYVVVLFNSETPDDAHALATGFAIFAAFATVGVILLASLFKSMRLKRGGGVVARQLGGTLVSTDTSDPAYRKLRNVVEEIAIASGIPVPEIYVLEGEAGINAFAAGWNPADAAIAVTRGAIEQLTRDELQGVIAHEFSHVLNGDMRLNIRLMGILFGILVIGLAGRHLLDATRGGSRGKGAGGIALIALAMFVVGYTGLFFGRLIKAGVSRQREFLADASAVQFTRQNRGIAGALRKIQAASEGSKIAAPDVEEVTHMLFGDGVGYSALFATHPPLAQRLARLDPTNATSDVVPPRAAPSPANSASPPPAPQAAQPAARPSASVESAAGIAMLVGNPSPAHYEAAHGIRIAIPEDLRQAAHRQDDAAALVFALALDPGEAIRARQLSIIEAALGVAVRDKVAELAPAAAALPAGERLPLAQLAFPTLRRRPRAWLADYAKTLDAVLSADASVSIADYCLARLVGVQVLDTLAPTERRVVGRAKLHGLRMELAVVLATLARHGHADDDTARRAYVDGLRGVVDGVPPYLPPGDSTAALDRALAALDRLDAPGKALVVDALVRVIAHDRRIGVVEAELLRVVCASIHCPLPPLVEGA